MESMKGIHYVIDETGRDIAVQIDLTHHRELWEDFQDVLIAEERESEPAIPYEQYRSQRFRPRQSPSLDA
jgi:hypothetical protein